jgi:hypothetical protein
MKKFFPIFILFFSILCNYTRACTTAVISGKYTNDGRSIIWKLRDSDEPKNSMRYFADGVYPYLGLVNSTDIKGENVWAGANSTGFAIMNSASYNVNIENTSPLKDKEGIFMKLALQTCATLQDFEQLLETYPKPRGIAANFGVMDAKGGIAFYEVDNWKWTKFDANNPQIAPKGYIIRTNYSETGINEEKRGAIRRQTAEKIFGEAAKKNKLNYRTVIQEFSRCFYHPVFGIDYRKKYETGRPKTDFVPSDDFITRYSSVSALIIQSVKPEEFPDMTTIWTLIGYPATTVAMPLWLHGNENIPKILQYDSRVKNSPLNEYALEWKKACYPINNPEGYHYLKMTQLVNPNKTGYIQRIEPLEKEIFMLTDEKLAIWRKTPPHASEIEKYYEHLNKKVSDFYTAEKSR